jgi:DNA-binding NarL/FixJ family response regulator
VPQAFRETLVERRIERHNVSVRVAVWDPLPIYRCGMMTALAGAGFSSEEPEDLLEWSSEQQYRVALLTVQSKQELTLLTQLKGSWPDLILIAVLAEEDVEMHVKAVKAGATAAVGRTATPEEVLQVFNAAIRGVSMLPAEAVRTLAAPDAPQRNETSQLTPREIEWLRALSQGSTVAQLAENVGYSERAMYRLLRGMYRRMHAANRTEAVLKASRAGWL